MTQPDNPKRLPPEVEFQAKREELLSGLRQLEENGKVNPLNSNVISIPAVYFLEGVEVFRFNFVRYQYNDQSGTIKSERVVKISPLKTEVRFNVLKEDGDGNLSGSNAKPVRSIRGLDELINIVGFINHSIPIKSSSSNPIVDIPDVIRVLGERVRKTKKMKFEYKKPEFYDALEKVRKKTVKLEEADESRYERGESVALATTGWVKVEKDGKEFELKFETADQLNNGSYAALYEVSKREIGDEGEGQYLFGETQLWSITFNPIRTVKQLQKCIDMLKLLNRAIPTPVSSSS